MEYKRVGGGVKMNFSNQNLTSLFYMKLFLLYDQTIGYGQ
jgi:hypothetical protein